MQKWEYLVLQISYNLEEAGGRIKWVNGETHAKWGQNRVKIYSALNELGREGWELVGIEKRGTQSNSDPLYVLKRPAS